MKCGDDGFFMPHFMQIMTTKSSVGGIVVARGWSFRDGFSRTPNIFSVPLLSLRRYDRLRKRSKNSLSYVVTFYMI